MNLASWIILSIIAVAVALIIYYLRGGKSPSSGTSGSPGGSGGAPGTPGTMGCSGCPSRHRCPYS